MVNRKTLRRATANVAHMRIYALNQHGKLQQVVWHVDMANGLLILKLQFLYNVFYSTATVPFFTMSWERTILRDGATVNVSLRSYYSQLTGIRHGKFSRPLVLSAQFRLFYAKLA